MQLDAKVCEIETSLNIQGDAAKEPTLLEVTDYVKKLRNTAAPGEDGITSPLFKECSTTVCWLHWVILAIWKLGRALVAWKRALVVPLYKGKGSQQCSDNYRRISLLSIPGKVYAMLLMHKVNRVDELKLLKAQCDFRSSRGTTNAMFVLHQLASMVELTDNTQLHMAFIDLTKAYDWVNKDALWRILCIYRVPSRIV